VADHERSSEPLHGRPRDLGVGQQRQGLRARRSRPSRPSTCSATTRPSCASASSTS
jgi:hypothetical protein